MITVETMDATEGSPDDIILDVEQGSTKTDPPEISPQDDSPDDIILDIEQGSTKTDPPEISPQADKTDNNVGESEKEDKESVDEDGYKTGSVCVYCKYCKVP